MTHLLDLAGPRSDGSESQHDSLAPQNAFQGDKILFQLSPHTHIGNVTLFQLRYRTPRLLYASRRLLVKSSPSIRLPELLVSCGGIPELLAPWRKSLCVGHLLLVSPYPYSFPSCTRLAGSVLVYQSCWLPAKRSHYPFEQVSARHGSFSWLSPFLR
jgi:hypothetical protein